MMPGPLVLEDDDRMATAELSGPVHPHVVLMPCGAFAVAGVRGVIVMYDLYRGLIRLGDILKVV